MSDRVHATEQAVNISSADPILLDVKAVLRRITTRIGREDMVTELEVYQAGIWVNQMNALLWNIQDSDKVGQLGSLLDSMVGRQAWILSDLKAAIIASLNDVSDALRARKKLGELRRTYWKWPINMEVLALLAENNPEGFQNPHLPQ